MSEEKKSEVEAIAKRIRDAAYAAGFDAGYQAAIDEMMQIAKAKRSKLRDDKT